MGLLGGLGGVLFLMHAVAFSIECPEVLAIIGSPKQPDSISQYAMVAAMGRAPTADLGRFSAQVGIEVTRRDGNGQPIEGMIRVLSDNAGNQLSIVSDYNGWGRSMHPSDHLAPVPGTPYFEGVVRELRDGMQYRLLLNGQQVLDPAATQFTTPEMIERFRMGETPFLNSIFFDLERDGFHTRPLIDFRGRPILISEISVYELAARWEQDGAIGPHLKGDTYRFIAQSAIPKEIARRGYTHIEFLPFNSSVDGDRWQVRYQVFGLYGPDSRYGTPAEFARMVEAFAREGVGVIMDSVLGHYPFRGNNGVRALEPIGIHRFINGRGEPLFGSKSTVWGTYRWDYGSQPVRRFLIDSVLTMLRSYGLSGIRIDNVDGIREQPGGNDFLRQLTAELDAYVPGFLILGEMFGDQAPALKPHYLGGLGFHAANDVDFFYGFVQPFLQAWDHEIQVRRLEWYLNDAWRWRRAFMQRWITNHDESANRQPGASGDYVATLLQGGGWDYVVAKTKVWGTLAMVTGSVYLDMLQMRFLQEGNFNLNSAIDWSLLKLNLQSKVDDYFTALTTWVRDSPAFAPQNIHPHISNHIDENNKVVSLLRLDPKTGSRTYVVINFGSRELFDYRIGVDASRSRDFRIVLNSDAARFGGIERLNNETLACEMETLHGKPHRLVVPVIAPLSALVIQQD